MWYIKKKEALLQSQSIASLKKMCSEQEHTINTLKIDLDKMREEQTNETSIHLEELKNNKISIQLKEEEIYLLKDQLIKLTKSLEEEKQLHGLLNSELAEVKAFNKKMNEQNMVLINQLELDNSEIKKRLIKLVK